MVGSLAKTSGKCLTFTGAEESTPLRLHLQSAGMYAVSVKCPSSPRKVDT